MGRKTQSGGGGRPSGNSAFTHQESMAAAQMLQASFQSSGGKSVANSKRKPAVKHQEKFDFPEKPRGKQQPNSYTDNIPPLYSDQIADTRPPLPSQRKYDNPGSFALGARKSTGTMAGWAIGTEARAFLAGNYKSQDDAGSVSNARQPASQSVRPTASATQPLSPNTQATVSTKGSAVQAENLIRSNGQPSRHAVNQAPCHQPAGTQLGGTTPMDPSTPADKSLQPTKELVVNSSVAPGLPQGPRDASFQPSVATNAGAFAKTSSQQVANSHPEITKVTFGDPGDVLEQLKQRFLKKAPEYAKKAACASNAATTEVAAGPPIEAETHGKANHETKKSHQSTMSSVASSFRDLSLEDAKVDGSNANNASTGPAEAASAKREQQLPITSQKQTSLPQNIQAWLDPIESEAQAPVVKLGPSAATAHTVASPSETADTSNGQKCASPEIEEPARHTANPKSKKPPGLESSMFNTAAARYTPHTGLAPTLSAKAHSFTPSHTGTVPSPELCSSHIKSAEPHEHTLFYPLGHSTGFLYTITQVYFADGYMVPVDSQGQLLMLTPMGVANGHLAAANQVADYNRPTHVGTNDKATGSMGKVAASASTTSMMPGERKGLKSSMWSS